MFSCAVSQAFMLSGSVAFEDTTPPLFYSLDSGFQPRHAISVAWGFISFLTGFLISQGIIPASPQYFQKPIKKTALHFIYAEKDPEGNNNNKDKMRRIWVLDRHLRSEQTNTRFGYTDIHLNFFFLIYAISCWFGLQPWNLAALLILTCSFSWWLVDEIQFMLISIRHICIRSIKDVYMIKIIECTADKEYKDHFHLYNNNNINIGLVHVSEPAKHLILSTESY